MADSAPNEFRRRYARPGELDTSILETHSVEKRPAVQPTRSNKTSTPPTGIVASKSIPLRQSVELNRKSPPPLTGEGAISSKRAARFELLPDQKSRWGRMGLSAVGQLVTLGLLLLSPMVFPQTMQTALKFDVVELMQPATEIPAPPATPPPPPRPQIKPKTPPRPPEIKPGVPEPPPMLPPLGPRPAA